MNLNSDYFRFILVGLSWSVINQPKLFLPIYAFQAVLDCTYLKFKNKLINELNLDFDGYFARKLNQSTRFGAWLDVVIDNLGRGIIWIHVHEVFC